MGNSQSQVAKIVNESSMSVTNNFVSTTIASTVASSTNMQTFTLNVGVIDHCPLAIGQTIQADVAAIAEVTDDQASELSTQLQTTLDAAVDQSTEMVNGLAAATGGNAQNTSTDIKNIIRQSITNNINRTTINQVAASSFNEQTMTLNIGACQYSPINATQGIVSNVIAQNILTKISRDIASSNLVASASASATQTTSMKNKGLDDLVKAIFDGLTGIWGIIAVVACVLIIGAVIFLLSPAGQEASVTLADAGAKKISGPF